MLRSLIALMLILVFLANPVFAAATQVDSLIEKLVAKGILSKSEARELKSEIAQDAKVINEDAAKAVVPDWVKNTKVKGDVRVRYQYERKANDTEARTRGRLRFRLGLENQIDPQWKIAAGLATSETSSTTDDPRSTNMTFNKGFARGDMRLDYAYIEYQPASWSKLIGGKFVKTDYLWTVSDMIWDSDINPAGFSAHVEAKPLSTLTAFANSGIWVIDENNKNDRTDPFLYYLQSGLKYKQNRVDGALGVTYYGYNGVKGLSSSPISSNSNATLLNGTACTNSGLSGSSSSCSGTLIYDYDAIGLSTEWGLKNPISSWPIERVAVFGDLVYNVSKAVSDDGSGWAFGTKIGDEKVAGPRQWQLKYQWTSLGKDAVLDILPDSDRNGGATDSKGHEIEWQYGLSKNVVLGLDYYQDARIKATKNPQKVVQADVNVKF